MRIALGILAVFVTIAAGLFTLITHCTDLGCK